MKILIISAYYKEEARSIPTTYKLAQLLAYKGNEVVVLTSKSISRNTYEPHKNIKIYETKDVFIKDPLNINVMPFLFGELSRVLKKEKPDVCVISKYIFFPIVAVPYLKMKGVPVVVVTDTYPGVVWFTRSKAVNFLAKMHYHIVGRTLVKGADLLVLTHEELVSATRDLGIKHHAVIHNGINLDKVDRVKPASDIRKSKGEIIVTFVGRLASIKGIDTLMKAAEQILKRFDNVKFILVGDGNKDFVVKHKKIHVLGYRPDVLSVLKKSDVVVMPSISEGLPAAVIEAMACSLPVVGSDIPGGMKVLVRNNVTGLSFKVGDAKDLEHKLERLILSEVLRKKLGRNARKLIEKEFNNEKVYTKWMHALTKLKKGARK
jgi:glycosyltransferase involved in cell wall biosynthesis